MKLKSTPLGVWPIKTGVSVVQYVKNAIPERIKGPIIAMLGSANDVDLEEWRGKKKVVIGLAGFYQNLGDMALTYAQKRFIENTLPGYAVLMFPSSHTYSHMKALKSVVGPEDIITTIGGGNMDELYSSLEDARRFLVKSFPNNPVISFPQTISFSNSSKGRKALKRSYSTYRKHSDLIIFGREPSSFQFATTSFPNVRTALAPDTVLSLFSEFSHTERSGIMVTIRQDKESILSPSQRDEIRRIASHKFEKITVRDTVEVKIEETRPEVFEKTLSDFWYLVRSHKIVVTDRLHCMIFCAITGTPAVVLPNSNHKIRETYQTWLAGLPSIQFVEQFDSQIISESIDSILELDSSIHNVPDLTPKFDSLTKALLDAKRKF